MTVFRPAAPAAPAPPQGLIVPSSVERLYIPGGPLENPAPNMYTESVYVTPQLAQEWLDRPLPCLEDGTQVVQRNKYTKHVDDMVADQENGDWEQLSPQGLALAEMKRGGGVVDGQQRLYAVTRSGLGQWFRVTFEVPPHLFYRFDVELKVRTTADHAVIHRQKRPREAGSLNKMLAVWDRYLDNPGGRLKDWTLWSKEEVTHKDQAAIYRKYPQIADVLEAVAPFSRGATKFRLSSAALFRMWVGQVAPECVTPPGDGQLCIVDAWLSEISGDAPTGPILLLRDWLTSKKSKVFHGAGREAELMAFLRAWEKTHNPDADTGKERQILRVARNDHLFAPCRPKTPKSG